MHDATHPASLTVEIEDCGATAVVHCRGKLVAGVTDVMYRPAAALISSHRRIILDLADLTHMDSMGLGSLVRLYVAGKARGTTVELRNLVGRVRELMIMSNLLPVFSNIGEHDIRM